MKLQSIQFKFISTVIAAILVIAICVGGLCIYEMNAYVENHTKEVVEIMCSNETSQVNDVLGNIENSVHIMESYMLSLFKASVDIQDPDRQSRLLELAGEMFPKIAANTDGALSYYLRFAPEISDSKTGIFHSKLNGSDEYVHLEPTDISLYEKDDIEHVGWYWIPYEAGQATWMSPYYNQNNDALMISFVIPLYHNGMFAGVVGMDFDYAFLTERVHKISIFNHGFAHLELNGNVIHKGYESTSEHIHATDMTDDYFQASGNLINGMNLVLFASYDDIAQIRLDIAHKIVIAVVLLTSAFILIVFYVLKKIVTPLKKLTEASIKLANGDYNVEIEHGKTYEIRQLSTAFENMTMNLREHQKLQHLLAYRDPLTGLRNATSFKQWAIDFNKKLQEENDFMFGVAVFDVNDLKVANDNFGHNTGNLLLTATAHLISDTFKRSPVFRIGGDEFLTILQGRDLEEYDSLIAEFETACENEYVEAEDVKIGVSVAKGFSKFDAATDVEFSDVFDRADALMYANKKGMKLYRS